VSSLGVDNFDQLSWHDNHCYGFDIEEQADGVGRLRLDLDHIVEWLKKDGRYSFRVAPAFLIFHQVSDLTVSLNYAVATAAIGPFSIHEVRRERISHPNGHSSYSWEIDLNWPEGRITFRAPSFSQEVRAPAVETERQHLSAEERRALLSGGAP